MRKLLVISALLGVTLVGCSSEKTSEPSKVSQFEQALSKAQFSLVDAIAAARAAQPGATVIDADLEVEDGPAVFTVVVTTKDGALELTVDIASGQIIDTQPDDGEGASACALGVTFEQAIDIAQRETGGKAVEIELDACTLHVNVVADRALWGVELGADGSVTNVRQGADDDEDDDDGEQDDD
jgi:uncharacterized membrane protein YkoI